MKTITGAIVRRSCLGKELSFADIRCTDEQVVKVAFRRHVSWKDDAESSSPFPVKRADIPYGARVSVQLQAIEGSQVYNVVSWKILEDPKQTAQAMAAVVGGEQALGGLSYSTYLRERGNQFVQHNTLKGQRIRENNGGKTNNNTKRPRTTTTTTPTTATTTNNNTAAVNDDLAQEGGHGDKTVKAQRAKLFAQWLLETFGPATLGSVLDVAGGKGRLSIELAATGKVPCVVIDPLIRKKHSQNGNSTGSSFPVKRDAKRIRKAGGPLPRHLPTYFNSTTFVERYGNTQDNNNNHKDDDSSLIPNCSTLVGLHPDQTTEDILDVALRYHKSVAIVPCCVFPSFFPIRQLEDGTVVNNHTEFCRYLCEKDASLKRAVLPFSGRNVVIYRIVGDNDTKMGQLESKEEEHVESGTND